MNIKNTLLTTALFISTATSLNLFAQEKGTKKDNKNKNEIVVNAKEDHNFSKTADYFAHHIAKIIVEQEFYKNPSLDIMFDKILEDEVKKFEALIDDEDYMFTARSDLEGDKYTICIIKSDDTIFLNGKEVKHTLLKEFEIDNKGSIKEFKTTSDANNKRYRKYKIEN